jgi:lipoprotein-anchoring transpeptidase ErfK/SrfK
MQANWKSRLRQAVQGSNPYYPSAWKVTSAFALLTLPLALAPQPAPEFPAAQQPQVVASAQQPVAAVPERKIVVSIPHRKLAVVEHGHVKKIYRVAVGASVSPSPAGTFHIANKVAQPVYWHKGKVIAAGPANPLGARWMGLDMPHYGIHGTNEPGSIGQAASHGCIRMAASDVKELYALAQVGDEVEIVAQPTQEVSNIFGAENAAGQ